MTLTLETFETLVTIVGGIFGIVGVVLAFYEFLKRRKVENSYKVFLQSTAGDVAKIRESTMWAYNNFREAQQIITSGSVLANGDLIRKISDGHGDAAAADRMLVNLFNNVLSTQEGTFGTRGVKHPESKTLDLVQKEMEIKG